MCVIICLEKKKSKLKMLKNAETFNPHGGGIAWTNKSDQKVHWIKGKNLTSKEIHEISQAHDLPQIVHFRIASIGGISDELTHPFPITANVKPRLFGSADRVLFHNGTWEQWQEACKESCLSNGLRFPDGEFSDSRSMAWLASHHGINILSLIKHQKIAVLTTEGIRRFGDHWDNVRGFKCSNDYFDSNDNGFKNIIYGSNDYEYDYVNDQYVTDEIQQPITTYYPKCAVNNMVKSDPLNDPDTCDYAKTFNSSDHQRKLNRYTDQFLKRLRKKRDRGSKIINFEMDDYITEHERLSKIEDPLDPIWD